jgi:NAD(P)-dependent dehydrogenase (short-subunit alcohol dehydrogenase family)
MRTIAITGSASGIGAATKQALEAEGARVIGVDLAKADIEADLSQPDGRAQAIAQLRAACDGRLDGLVTCAGISGTRFSGSQITSVNYFGTVELLEGLRPALAQGEAASAVAISSNSTTTMPNIPDDLVEACLSGDVAKSSALADAQPFFAYAASKTALTRWVRRNAVGDDWAGAGITLNAVAPGRTRTAMDDGMLKDEILGPHVEAFPIPIGRPGRAEEIGDFVAFLLGPKGRFFCGAMLCIDGGTDALMRADDWPVSLRR